MQTPTTSRTKDDDCRATRRRRSHDRLGLAQTLAYVAVVAPGASGITHVSSSFSTSDFGLRFAADRRGRIFADDARLADEDVVEFGVQLHVDGEGEHVDGKTVAVFSSLAAAETWLANETGAAATS